MRFRVTHYEDDNANQFDYARTGWISGADNSADILRMKRLLREAVKNSLTDRQKLCILAYCSGKKQKEIAAELGLSPSTVNRHIMAAKRRLRNIAQYYE